MNLKNCKIVWIHLRSFCFSDCGSLPDPVNGVVNTSAGTTYTEVANYTCDIGYNLVGDNQRNCMANGQWSGSAPVCNIKGIINGTTLFNVLPSLF